MTSPRDRHASFDHLVRLNRRIVFQIAMSVVGNVADAEDVTQDAFVRALVKFEHLRDPQRFRAWVCQIARNTARNHRRSEGRIRQREEQWYDDRTPGRDVAAALEEDDFQCRLRHAIQRLPEHLRDVVLLCAIEELEPSDVARILRIPAGTVRSRLHAARKRLMQMMSP